VEVYEEESCVSRGALPQNMGCGIGDHYQKKRGMFFETSYLLLSGRTFGFYMNGKYTVNHLHLPFLVQ
jgi:hypothetical protein